MDKKLQEAISLYAQDKLEDAEKLFREVISLDAESINAWYGLAQCRKSPLDKVECLKRVLSIDPSHERARLELENLNSTVFQDINKPVNRSAINWFTILLSFLVVIAIIGGCVILFVKGPYQPTTEDAFSYAAGYALSGMYARNPRNYGCTITETKQASYWYEIKVTDLGSGRYNVIGATKAIDKYCIYHSGYFANTVYYDAKQEDWKLEGEVYYSNGCQVLKGVGTWGGECTYWNYYWKPDMNWRPPNR